MSGPGKAVPTPQAVGSDEDARLFQLRHKLCHECSWDVLQLGQVETADRFGFLDKPDQAVKNIFGACAIQCHNADHISLRFDSQALMSDAPDKGSVIGGSAG